MKPLSAPAECASPLGPPSLYPDYATLAELCTALREHPNFQEKLQISRAFFPALSCNAGIPVGDDAAAIPDGDGFLLFAAEGLMESFIEKDPWFAGYCAVMVNLSDIAAMGGVPVAITDVLWAHCSHPAHGLLWEGMQAASHAYGVPIVGGHTTRYPENRTPLLAAAVLGKTRHLISSFAAQPGHTLVVLLDLSGSWRGENTLFFNASTSTPPEQLQRQLRFPAQLAEAGLVTAGKDISNGGLPGTLAMLLATSRCGATLDLDSLPRPAKASLLRWLLAFPSYGFLFSVPPEAVGDILQRSRAMGLTAAAVGNVDASPELKLHHRGVTEPLTAIT